MLFSVCVCVVCVFTCVCTIACACTRVCENSKVKAITTIDQFTTGWNNNLAVTIHIIPFNAAMNNNCLDHSHTVTRSDTVHYTSD